MIAPCCQDADGAIGVRHGRKPTSLDRDFGGCVGARRAIIAIALAWLPACRSGSDQRCRHHIDAHDWTAAYTSCLTELDATGDLARAYDAARAAYYLHRPSETIRLATRALAGPKAADAHTLIGATELSLDHYAPAASHLEIAAQLHAAAGNAAAEARDWHQLAGVAYQRGDYQAALDAEATARRAATRANDHRMVVLLDIARSDILRRIGDLRGAEAEIERALVEARAPEDRIMALLKRGEVHLDQGHPALAREPLTRALDDERRAALPSKSMLEALHLNLAYVERKARAFDRALDHIEQAKQGGTDEMSYRLNRGLIYAEMGRFAEANSDFIAAEAEQPEGEWSWWVPYQRAQAAAHLGDLAAAVAADRRAMQQVAKLAASSGAFGPTVVAAHREPHLHLIGLLAAQQRWGDVLEVIATMDSQLLLDSREAASDRVPSANAARPAAPQGAGAPGALASGAARGAIDAWRGRRLVIAVPGGERLWRIDIDNGTVRGRAVGDADALAALARKLEAEPDNAEAGRALGQALLPDPRSDRGWIELLVVGPVARAPLAGLRAGDAVAIASIPLVRARGFLPRPAAEHGSAAPLVIGDPGNDLAAAAGEARRVAAHLATTARVGAAATRSAFASAAGATLLHIAAHTTERFGDAVIELADGPLGVDAIARLVPPPRFVMLATCGGAAGRDDAGNGSLVSAFLDAGADVVIGTRWSVDDAEAAKLSGAFYAAGGAREPIAALMTAQLTSGAPVRTAAAFEAFVARPVR